jgi:hypothetical protein
MSGQDREQRPEHEAGHSFVALFGEVDDVEIEVVVPYPVDAGRHVDQRRASSRAMSLIMRLCAGVSGDDVIDRLEHHTPCSLGSGTRLKPNCKRRNTREGTSQRNNSVGRQLLCRRPSECASEQPPYVARRAERRTSMTEQY